MLEDDTDSEEDGCECPKDADGQCDLCRADTINGCKGMVEAITNFVEGAEQIEREMKLAFEGLKPIFDKCCEVCLEQYADLGLSKLVSGLQGSEDWMPRGIFQKAKEAFARKGITAMPLSDKAWADLCASRGWTP